MLYLVTGGAGFLGSHLVDRLLASGNEVVVADDLSTGSLRNLDSAQRSGGFRFVHCDVAQPFETLQAALREAVAQRPIATIFHLASPASPDAYTARPWATLAVNALGTMALLDLAVHHGARFVYASTSEIYGDPLVHPQPETYFGNVDTLGPRACYDEGKRFGEAAVSVAVRTRGVDARIVRFFNCYGPRLSAADGRLIPALVDALDRGVPFPIHGTGRQTRSMTYVDDALELALLVAARAEPPSRAVNIGNDEELTVLDIARTFAVAAGVAFETVHEPARPGDPERRRPDLTVARALGWQPRTPLETGLRATLAWFETSRPARLPNAIA